MTLIKYLATSGLFSCHSKDIIRKAEYFLYVIVYEIVEITVSNIISSFVNIERACVKLNLVGLLFRFRGF